jgi:hypothetical protein
MAVMFKTLTGQPFRYRMVHHLSELQQATWLSATVVETASEHTQGRSSFDFVAL